MSGVIFDEPMTLVKYSESSLRRITRCDTSRPMSHRASKVRIFGLS